jgi:hypothetical protein
VSADPQAALAAYARFFETLTPERLPGLAALVTPDVRFKDPFNDVCGVDDMVRALETMYRHGTPRFEVLDRATGAMGGYLLWRFTNDPGKGGTPLVILGMSAVDIAPDGRIREHIDHWDSGTQFYAKLPVLGWLIRLVNRRLALPPRP